jgi:MFS family permease
MLRIPYVSKKLASSGPFAMSLFAACMAFLTYSSMYAFRKPFAAATFEGEVFWGMDIKVWLILAQTLGYMASKFYGIKMISELTKERRAVLILGLITVAWLALLGFAVLPAPLNIVCFVVNGFPLGLIWGLVFHYLEGRRFTEMMGSILAVSFVFSSGFVKTVGKFLLDNLQVDPYWMPFWTGALFMPLLAFAVLMLNQTPDPSGDDIALKTARLPMSKQERRAFFRHFRPGIILLILVYMMLTALRDIRDNFAVEIWEGLHIPVHPELLTQTEIPITLVLLLMMSLLVLVKNNRKALFLYHGIIIGGLVLCVATTVMVQASLLDPFWWVVATGTGIYMAYIPFNCLLFDRLLAAFKYAGTVGYLMYLIDSFGYLGSAGVMVFKQFGNIQDLSWLNFYSNSLLIMLSLGVMCMFFNALYIFRKLTISESMATASKVADPVAR